MKIKAVIFDFDGTLVDTCADIALCINVMLSHFGYKNKTYDEVRSALCFGPVKLVYKVLPCDVANDEKTLKECVDYYRGVYNVSENKLTHSYDGIVKLLSFLKDNGIRVAINTNKNQNHTENIIKGIFDPSLIDMIVGFSEEHPAKPDPYGALTISNAFGIDPLEIVYVGDSDIDIQTAKNAGMIAVGVSWGYRSRDVLERANPDFIADDAKELSDIIFGLI